MSSEFDPNDENIVDQFKEQMKDFSSDRVRDAAISMVTSMMYSLTLDDQKTQVDSFIEGLQASVPDEMTPPEYGAIPGVLVQFVSIFIRMSSMSMGITPQELWEKMVPYIREADMLRGIDPDA